MTSFLRKLRVSVGPPGLLGRAWEDLDISVVINKDRSNEPNTAKIRIYNLNEASRGFVEEEGFVVLVEAGYGSTPASLFFVGDIDSVKHQRAGVDMLTEIEASDGGNILYEGHVSVYHPPGATRLQVLQAMAADLGLVLRVSNDGETSRLAAIPYTQALSIHTSASAAMRNVAESAGFEVSIQNGMMVVLPIDGETFDVVPLVSVDTGMIGSPERAQLDVSGQGRRDGKRPGVIVSGLANVQLDPGSVFRLESQDVSGDFVVHEVEYELEKHGRIFQYKAEATERERV